jgi:TonB family protein
MRKTLLQLGVAAVALMLAPEPAFAVGKSCAQLSNPPTDLEIVDNAISKGAPGYPQQAVAERLEGFVRLKVIISPQGDVVDVQVVKAEPRGVFEQSAVDAAKTWKYCASGRTITLQLDVAFKLPPKMRDQSKSK